MISAHIYQKPVPLYLLGVILSLDCKIAYCIRFFRGVEKIIVNKV